MRGGGPGGVIAENHGHEHRNEGVPSEIVILRPGSAAIGALSFVIAMGSDRGRAAPRIVPVRAGPPMGAARMHEERSPAHAGD